MKDFNKEEKKAYNIIKNLKQALSNNDQNLIGQANEEIDVLDATKVRQALLDELDDLFEHKNYKISN